MPNSKPLDLRIVPYLKIPGRVKKDQGINLAWEGARWILDFAVLLSFKVQFTCFYWFLFAIFSIIDPRNIGYCLQNPEFSRHFNQEKKITEGEKNICYGLSVSKTINIIYSKESYELFSHKTCEQTWASKRKWPNGKTFASERTNSKVIKKYLKRGMIQPKENLNSIS